MARVVCLSDTLSLVRAIHHELAQSEHMLRPLPCSRLNDALRYAIRQASPDIILLELAPTLDNPHVYFFLRADEATRDIPVILLSSLAHMEVYAEALGADGFLLLPVDGAILRDAIDACLNGFHSPTSVRPRQATVERQKTVHGPTIIRPLNV